MALIFSLFLLISCPSVSVAGSAVCSKFSGIIGGVGTKVKCNGSPSKIDQKPIDSGEPGPGGGGYVTQPVSSPTDIDIIERKNFAKRAPNLIPCASSEASDNKVIAPPDATGVVTDPRTAQTYLCLAKTSETEPVAYELPDGTVVEAPEPIIVTVEDMKNLGLLASTPHQERAPHTLKNYHTKF